MEINNARIQYHNAKKRLDNRKRNLELAERIYNTTQIKYKEGVGSSLEINQAEQSLFDSQRNHTQALYELLSAQFSLNKALGTRY
jgi:outer membrane protein TolC